MVRLRIAERGMVRLHMVHLRIAERGMVRLRMVHPRMPRRRTERQHMARPRMGHPRMGRRLTVPRLTADPPLMALLPVHLRVPGLLTPEGRRR